MPTSLRFNVGIRAAVCGDAPLHAFELTEDPRRTSRGPTE